MEPFGTASALVPLLPFVLMLLLLAAGLVALRVRWCLAEVAAARPLRPTSDPVRTMVVLGSGGHTAEMLSFFPPCDPAKFSPRHYVVAATDTHSLEKVRRMEAARDGLDQCTFHRVSRAREVAQSWITTVFTTLRALLSSCAVVASVRPQLIVCNGPGTCVPLCVAAVLLRVVGLGPPCSIVFVESFCRVRTLSLTGRLLYPWASLFVVQWQQLRERYPKAVFVGNLC